MTPPTRKYPKRSGFCWPPFQAAPGYDPHERCKLEGCECACHAGPTSAHSGESDQVLLTWRRRLIEDARAEFSTHVSRFRYSGVVRWWKRNVAWRIESRLLAWTERAEPCDDADLRYLAEDDSGEWLMPRGLRDGEPWWQGYWRWWRPDHWPAYFRSRRDRTYVMVEAGPW